jgi:hypothetical protein
VYRTYDGINNVHFFTKSSAERDAAVRGGHIDEGIGFYVFQNSNAERSAIFRLKAPNPSFAHYMTINAGERDERVGQTWIFETQEGFIHATAKPGTTEIYHLYNHSTGSHLYTTNAAAKAQILSLFPDDWVSNASLGFGPPGP